MRSFGLVILGSVALSGCGGELRRFPLKEPVWKDTGTQSVAFQCVADDDPPKDDPQHQVCLPESYESPFGWDVADKVMFRPLSRMLAVDVGGEAKNVNAFDEVPDSSWFVNRIGRTPMTVDEVVSGPCGKKVLDPSAADGSWLIDQGKPNGANPGFRVRVEGVGKFMLKADPPDQPERATGATSIATRLYHAAGWYAPCDSVVYFRPSILKLKPGLKSADNSGVVRSFDEAALAKVLEGASRRGDLVRMVASRWLPGRALGPFKYEDTRDDDPNDTIPHEDRRDLRGAKVIAAWLNHFDSREQNSMNTWMADNEKDPDSSPGHIRHWYIDLGDCFGSEWEWEAISKRLGHSYYLDLSHLSVDFLTLGIIERPWDRAERSKEGDIFGFFNVRDFDPDLWKGGYPNPSFDRMTEHDAAWAARIIARFEPEHVVAAVGVGDYTSPVHVEFLTHTLLERQRILLRRYLGKLSPISDLTVSPGGDLCGVDLGAKTRVFEGQTFTYKANVYTGEAFTKQASPAVRPGTEGGVCLSLTHIADDAGPPPNAPARYMVVDIENGIAQGPLRAHLYDLGPSQGFKLVGIERPDDMDPPG